MICGILESEIVNNMTKYEIFKIICRINDIDIQENAQEIYEIIETFGYAYKDDYIGVCAYEDESMEIEDRFFVDIDNGLLYGHDDYIKDLMDEYDWLSYEEAKGLAYTADTIIVDEFSDKNIKFINLAIECGIKRIILKYI